MNNKNKNKTTLLLVDDEPDITLPFSMGLEDNGFEVDVFNDPLSALEAFKGEKRNKPYSLALIDIKMPKMTGIGLYNEMRKINDKVKVCFITAFDMPIEDENSNIIETPYEKPVIIQKPIAIEDLVKRVKAMV